MPTSRQHQAITSPLGPVLVLAGPGAGKTFCLIERIRYLIHQHGVRPERILAVTFTNKAAEEIATRLRDSLGAAAADVTRGTLHGLCVTVLRAHGEAIGLKPGFGIADQAYQFGVLGRLGVWPARRRGSVLTAFGRHRLEGRPLFGTDQRLFPRYVAYLRERQLLDFDDLIAHTADLLQRHPAVATAVAAGWDHVLVDEFQDLDAAQYAIVSHLTRAHRSVFGVGDDEQSIFTWRGANPEVLKRFTADFGISHPIVLDQNRRCSRQIFAAARKLVEENEPLFAKDLWSTRESAHAVRALAFPEEVAEARWIARDVMADQAATGKRWGDYAVLYRRHDVGALIERQMLRVGVPCRLAPRRALLDDPVVAAVVACLRLIRAPGDPAALDALAEVVLAPALREELRAEARRLEGDLLAAARVVGRRRGRADVDGKRAWRFVFQAENLAGLGRSHDTLRGLIDALLQQRVTRYRNVLEEHEDELSDPAAGASRDLADTLRAAHAAGGRIWIPTQAGLEIALRGLFLAAGWTSVGYLQPFTVLELGDVVLDPGLGGPLGVGLTTFKALQVLHSARADPGLQDYTAFDLETTDKDPEHCDIVEIAAVRVRAGVPVDEFRSLVRPTGPMAAGARATHGYDDATLAEAPPLGAVWGAFRAFVGQDVLVAHNAQRFDIPVLRRAAEPLGGVEELAFFDTLPLARAVTHGAAGLSALAERFGVPAGRAHHALDDARTLVAVLGALERVRRDRARRASLTNLLDYLGLALALEPAASTPEAALLRDVAGAHTLGRYSTCLEFYQEERDRGDHPDAPPLDTVIARLGGVKRMERLRAEVDPAQRHPTSMARLEALLEAAAAATLDASVDRFLERVALSTSAGTETARDRVNLLTLHATKGLEFSRVYVVGAEDGALPGLQALAENREQEIQEAR
ncbi:MAG TPA: UvrD-helicase domain-containing protein, partial [Gemmatimonadales bacterium]|nr:UvrD-helicase domain-containing protein [Gemmatimonadales bacterium]